MGFVILVIVIFGIGYIVYRTGKQDKQEKVIKEQPIVEDTNKPVMKRSLLTEEEKESSDRFREGLLVLNEIVITGNSIMLTQEEVEKKLISLATEFPEVIYDHACDRLKKYSSISSQDRTGLMYSLRDIIGEDMEQNIMNARNEKKIDEYFEELITSTVRMLRRL